MPKYRSAKILLFDAEGDVLVLRRSSTHPTDAFAPDLPGGMIQDGEDYALGVMREILEETRIVVSPTAIVPVHKTGTRFSVMQRILYAVHVDAVKPKVELSWEHDQFSWVKPKDIKELEGPVQKQVNKVINKALKRPN